MSPFPALLDRPVATLRVALEPAGNVFASMVLLAKQDGEMLGVHEWVTKTTAQMKKKEIEKHKLVILGFFYALIPEPNWTSFPAYLEHLASSDPIVLREKLLNAYASLHVVETSLQKVNWEEVLSSAENYIAFLYTRFDKAHVDEKLEAKAYEHVLDPPAMKDLLVTHMRWMWETHLSAEWSRVVPMLEEAVKAFQGANLATMSRIEAARYVTGQDLADPKWRDILESAAELTFVPNAHIGPYVHALKTDNTVSLIFGARQPEDTDIRIPELDRAEIVSRLSAIADDTRLHILQMIAERGEMKAQDIMEAINMSQPSVSRYLTQLSATGYLHERRVNSAKLYALNRDRIEKTLRAISNFLLRRK